MQNCCRIPRAARISIGDLLDQCAQIKPGQNILLLAEVQGLYGGDSLVDETAMEWLIEGIESRGAHAAMLWLDEPFTPAGWTVPSALRAAMQTSDVVINNSFDISSTDLGDLRHFIEFNQFDKNLKYVRNFATTAPLLCSDWAQTPHELISEIRFQVSKLYVPGEHFLLTDPNGTCIEGEIGAPKNPKPELGNTPYAERRGAGGSRYNFWPEWMHKPIKIENVNGVFIYDCMTPFWSRFIGIPPYFHKPVELAISNSRIVKISGGEEADALRDYLKWIKERFDQDVYHVNVMHSGVHPQTSIAPQQCPSPLIRRQIEHSACNNVHIHIGANTTGPAYDYYLQHCTADLRKPTLRVGNQYVHKDGHMLALEDPEVQAVAARYPDRPGIAAHRNHG